VNADPDIAQLRTRLDDALANGRTRWDPPLPWHTRARLALAHAIDTAAISLAGHGRYGAALRLWRATGLVREARRS